MTLWMAALVMAAALWACSTGDTAAGVTAGAQVMQPYADKQSQREIDKLR